MASFLTSGSNRADGTGAILDTVATLALTAGSCLIGWAKWEGANAAVPTFSKSDGSNLFTMRPVTNHSNNDLHSAWGYLLTHAMSGATTLRFVLDAARVFRNIIFMEFSALALPVFDTDLTAIQVTTATVSSGNIVANALSQIVVGGYAEYGVQTPASMTINGVATDGSVTTAGGNTTMWYKLNLGGFTGAAASANLGAAISHLDSILSLLVPSGVLIGDDDGDSFQIRQAS